MFDDRFPPWLSQRLLHNDFPWEEATLTTFPELLRRVTFHDGSWYGGFPAQYDNAMVLVLQPDAFWNREFCHQQEDWPYAVIEVSRVLNISRALEPEDLICIDSVESAPIDAVRFTEWLEFAKVYDLMPADFFDYQKPQPPLHRTEIPLLANGTLSFIHEARIRLLLYTATGERLTVQLPELKG